MCMLQIFNRTLKDATREHVILETESEIVMLMRFGVNFVDRYKAGCPRSTHISWSLCWP